MTNRQSASDVNIVQFDLDNGLHVILKEDHFAPVVAYQIWVQVGSADEHPDEAGLAHVMEHMLFKGTAKRGVGEIARDIESAGGDINAWTSFDETVYHIVMPSNEIDQGLDILSDAIQHAALDKTELAQELEVIREEIKRGMDSPQRRISEETFRISFSDHPYRNPVIGTDESVRSFTREKVNAFYQKWYAPQNMTLVMVGDFDTEELKGKLPQFFSSFQNGEVAQHQPTHEPEQTTPRVSLLTDSVSQAHVAITFPAVGVTHEDVPALEVLGILLGQGDSCRLVQRLQRDRTLVNDAYAYPYAGKSHGLFMLEAELSPDNTLEALQELAHEAFLFQVEPPSQAEIEKAKTIVENEAIYQQQTAQGKARRLGYFYSATGDLGFHQNFITRVKNLTAADLLDAARRYFRPQAANVVALLPTEMEAQPEKQQLLDAVNKGFELANQLSRPAIETDEHGIARCTLKNGVRVLIKQNDSVPLVSVQAAFLAGLRMEDETNNGVNNLLSRMLTLGTATKDARKIAELVDGMAGSLGGFSGRNTLGLKGVFVSRNFEKGFDLFSECLLSPALPESELEKEKYLVKEEIRARDESPAHAAFDLFNRTLYKEHPFRMDPMGSLESVEGISSEILHDYYFKHLSADRLVISVVGNISPDLVLKNVEARFGDLLPSTQELPQPTPETPQTEIRRNHKLLDKMQLHLVLGFPGLTFYDSKRYALDVLNAIIAGQGGRLFMELRDKQSLAYSVSSNHLESIDPGFFAVYIGSSPEKREQAITGILKELQRLVDGDISEKEVEDAKRYLIGSHAIGLQTNSAVSGLLLMNELYDIGYANHLKYPEIISGITLEHVVDVAKHLIRSDAYSLAEVGPKAD